MVGIFFSIYPFIKYDASECEKIVYLTFDDGPSSRNTERIVNILNNNKVNATFFVVGENVKRYPEMVKRLSDENMALFPHCNCHKYSELYSSKDNFLNDLFQCEETIMSLTGKKENIHFVRMPGGSDNKVCNSNVLGEIKQNLLQDNYYYIDWNVDIGDATATNVSTETLISNINKYAYNYKIDVVLMHDLDSKNTTIDALDRVIKDYKSKGYTFKTFNNISGEEIEYLKAIGVINR